MNNYTKEFWTMKQTLLKNDLFKKIETQFDENIAKGVPQLKICLQNFCEKDKEVLIGIVSMYKKNGYRVKHTYDGFIIIYIYEGNV